jgi:acetyl esterase/lipase
MGLRTFTTLACAGTLCIGLASCLPPGVPDFFKVPTPTLSVSPGTYTQNVDVRIQCSNALATIHYTTDGTEPTAISPVYNGTPVAITNQASGAIRNDPNHGYNPLTTASMTIKAIAMVPGLVTSEICIGVYVIDKVEATFDVAYDTPPAAGGNVHQLDIYRPRGLSGAKVVIIPHGGAWFMGDKSECFELGATLAGDYGYTTVAINYDLSSAPWNAVHPAPIRDVAKAFAWVYQHIADYGGDPEKIYLFGPSAGGYFVSLLATDGAYLAAEGLSTDKIKGVVSMSGTYDLYDLIDSAVNPLGLAPSDIAVYTVLVWNAFGAGDQAALDAASPITYVNASQPPFRITYAWKDMAGFDREAMNFHDRILALNGPYADLVEIVEADMPPEVLALNIGGHFGSPYAINTRDWKSRPTKLVVDFIAAH